jgi:hypothetical protein
MTMAHQLPTDVLAAISLGFELLEFVEQHGGIPGEHLYRTLVAEARCGRQIGATQ